MISLAGALGGMVAAETITWEAASVGSGDRTVIASGVKTYSPTADIIEAIEFLDDITLRYLDDISKPPGTHTHEVIVRKRSVLRVAP